MEALRKEQKENVVTDAEKELLVPGTFAVVCQTPAVSACRTTGNCILIRVRDLPMVYFETRDDFGMS